MRSKIIPLFLFVGFVLIISCITFNGCNTNKQTSCLSEPFENKSMNINIGSSPFQAVAPIWLDKNSNELSSIVIKKKQFVNICESLSKLTGFEKNIYAVFLYFNHSFLNCNALNRNNIIGVSYYYLDSEKLYHCLYKKQDSLKIFDKSLIAEVKYISTNDIIKIMESKFSRDKYNFVSWISLFSETSQKLNLNNPHHNLTKKLSCINGFKTNE